MLDSVDTLNPAYVGPIKGWGIISITNTKRDFSYPMAKQFN